MATRSRRSRGGGGHVPFIPAQNPDPIPGVPQVPQQDSAEGSWAPPPVSTAEETQSTMETEEVKAETQDTPMVEGENGEKKPKKKERPPPIPPPEPVYGPDGVELRGEHPKSLLYSKQMSGGKGPVVYDVVSAEKDAEQKSVVTVKCVINEEEFTGTASNKKAASLIAAEAALLKIYNTRHDANVPPHPSAKSRQNFRENKKRKAKTKVDGAEGEEGEKKEGELDADGDTEMLNKRPNNGEGGVSSKKKRKMMMQPPMQKNALMHLNELKPGTQFKFVSQSGNNHAPVFTMSVEINGQTYEGQGTSKKLAKLNAAETALRSFVQFPDASEAHQVLGRGFLPFTADFTKDADLSGTDPLLNNFDKNAAGGQGAVGDTGTGNLPKEWYEKIQKRLQKEPQSGITKPPVMVLNEIYHVKGDKDVKYELVSEDGEKNWKVFNMKVSIGGGAHEFMGSGRSKKIAKNNAALNALKTLHGICHFTSPHTAANGAKDKKEEKGKDEEEKKDGNEEKKMEETV